MGRLEKNGEGKVGRGKFEKGWLKKDEEGRVRGRRKGKFKED